MTIPIPIHNKWGTPTHCIEQLSTCLLRWSISSATAQFMLQNSICANLAWCHWSQNGRWRKEQKSWPIQLHFSKPSMESFAQGIMNTKWSQGTRGEWSAPKLHRSTQTPFALPLARHFWKMWRGSRPQTKFGPGSTWAQWQVAKWLNLLRGYLSSQKIIFLLDVDLGSEVRKVSSESVRNPWSHPPKSKSGKNVTCSCYCCLSWFFKIWCQYLMISIENLPNSTDKATPCTTCTPTKETWLLQW